MGLVTVKLYGELGQKFNKERRIYVDSVSEAIHSININSGRKFYPWLVERDKKGIRYKLLINNKPYKTNDNLDNLNNIKYSDLTIKKEDLRSIDIIPVIEGAGGDSLGGVFSIILGVLLVVAGIVFSEFLGPFSAPLIIAGIGLVAGGVINLLMRPPKFEDFREITAGGGRASYLFNGPQNVAREGGPVPIGYGRLIVGSQVVSAAYVVSNISADANIALANTNPGALDVDDLKKSGITHYPFVPSIPLSAIDDISGTLISLISGPTLSTVKTLFDHLGGFIFQGSTIGAYSSYNYPSYFNGTTQSDGDFDVTGYIITLRKTRIGITPINLVVGGDFTYRTGNGKNFFILKSIDPNTGAVSIIPGSANGIVVSSSSDTSGNIYIGGDFTSVSSNNGVAASYKRLAKIDGTTYAISALSGFVGAASSNGVDSTIRALEVDSSGNIYIGGNFTTINNVAHDRFAKLDSNGALATGFTFLDFNGTVRDIKINSDGKIYVCGAFTTVNGDPNRKYIVRLNSDGTIDTSFTSPNLIYLPDTTAISINSIYIQLLDSKILIGGKWNSITGYTNTTKNLSKLNTDGTIDTTMSSGFDPSESCDVFKVVCRDNNIFPNADGKIYIGGNWKKYDYQGKLEEWPRYCRLFNGDYWPVT